MCAQGSSRLLRFLSLSLPAPLSSRSCHPISISLSCSRQPSCSPLSFFTSITTRCPTPNRPLQTLQPSTCLLPNPNSQPSCLSATFDTAETHHLKQKISKNASRVSYPSLWLRFSVASFCTLHVVFFRLQALNSNRLLPSTELIYFHRLMLLRLITLVYPLFAGRIVCFQLPVRPFSTWISFPFNGEHLNQIKPLKLWQART